MRSLVRALPVLACLGLAAMAPLYGCANAEGPGAADPTRPPPKAVLAMPVRVQSGSDGGFAAALSDGLARAGFTVTTDPSAKADIILTPQVVVSQNTSAFQVSVNGRTKVKYTITVSVACDGQMTDSLHATYNDYEGSPPDDEAISTLVLAYAHSGRVAAFAKRQSSATAEASSDDQDWLAIDQPKCAAPTALDACDGVKLYMGRHPQGKHVGEATRLLTQSVAPFEKLQRDENSWQASGAADCKKKKTRETCVGVEVYLTKYPNGMHATEAHALLGK
ncbi:hypothetical protein BH09MYX1_BH09MYX1_01040 [soil metagenome]